MDEWVSDYEFVCSLTSSVIVMGWAGQLD